MTVAAWNQAPKRLWKRVSIYIRPDIHAAADEREENFTLFINNALARKYDLDPCMEGGVNRVRQIRRVEKASESLDEEIASISAELEDDRLAPDLRAELDRQRAEAIRLREVRMQSEVGKASMLDGIRIALDEIAAVSRIRRYWDALPENDPSGERIDDWDHLLAVVSRHCGVDVDPAEVAAEVRRRYPADPGEEKR